MLLPSSGFEPPHRALELEDRLPLTGRSRSGAGNLGLFDHCLLLVGLENIPDVKMLACRSCPHGRAEFTHVQLPGASFEKQSHDLFRTPVASGLQRSPEVAPSRVDVRVVG